MKGTLARKGYDVILAVETLGQGATNHEIAEKAMPTHDIILTFDEDLLRLRLELMQHAKAIYIRMHPRDPRKAQQLLDQWIDKCVPMLEHGHAVKLDEKGPALQTQ